MIRIGTYLDLIKAGGPGSGCNPDVGQCGRPPGTGDKVGQVPGHKDIDWKRQRDPEGVQNWFGAKVNGKMVEIKRDNSPTRIGKFRWVIMVDGQAVGKGFYKNAQAARAHFEKNQDKWAPQFANQPNSPIAEKPAPSRDVDSPRGEGMHQEIIGTRYLGGGVMGTYKVKFADGSRGVFKPQDGEVSARDDIKVGSYYQREAVAWDVAKIVGGGLEEIIPETVVRKAPVADRKGGIGPEKIGSVQKWVSGASKAPMKEDYLGGFRGVNVEKLRDLVDHDDLHRGAAFDYVLSNSDRHVMNFMLKGGKLPGGDYQHRGAKLAGVDHGLILGTRGRTSSAWYRAVYREAIPDHVKTSWAGKWDQLEGAMRARDISRIQIDTARTKYNAMLQAKNWDDLDDKGLRAPAMRGFK